MNLAGQENKKQRHKVVRHGDAPPWSSPLPWWLPPPRQSPASPMVDSAPPVPRCGIQAKNRLKTYLCTAQYNIRFLSFCPPIYGEKPFIDINSNKAVTPTKEIVIMSELNC